MYREFCDQLMEASEVTPIYNIIIKTIKTNFRDKIHVIFDKLCNDDGSVSIKSVYNCHSVCAERVDVTEFLFLECFDYLEYRDVSTGGKVINIFYLCCWPLICNIHASTPNLRQEKSDSNQVKLAVNSSGNNSSETQPAKKVFGSQLFCFIPFIIFICLFCVLCDHCSDCRFLCSAISSPTTVT